MSFKEEWLQAKDLSPSQQETTKILDTISNLRNCHVAYGITSFKYENSQRHPIWKKRAHYIQKSKGDFAIFLAFSIIVKCNNKALHCSNKTGCPFSVNQLY